MKYVASLGLATMLVTATPSLAQTAPATPDTNAISRQQQIRSQMEQMHAAERSQILAALTPANKTLLANVMGTLTTSGNPDIESAVRQLDAALSPAEKQAILDAARAAGTRERSFIQMMRQQSASSGQEAAPGRDGVPRGLRTDAGLVLLRHAMPDLGMGNSLAGPQPAK